MPPVPEHAELREASDHCPWAIVAIGDDGNVRWVNGAFERCTGVEPESVLSISEAAFEAAMRSAKVEHTRALSEGAGLRSIHYLRPVDEAHGAQLLSRLAEQLREPLASIYGFAELLLTQNYDDDLRLELTGTLLEQVEVMLNTINEKLDVSDSASRRNDNATR